MAGKKWGGNRSADAGFETMSDFETLAARDPMGSTSSVAPDENPLAIDTQQSNSPVKRSGPTLKARAIAILSRREHSRHELKQKLSAYADESDDIDALLDELARDNWQSDERFAQSLVNRRADRKGAQLILRELRQHGLTGEALAELSTDLADTELARARSVWERKFGVLPTDARSYAKQYRFLASRGFSSDSVRRILGDKD